MGLAVTKAEFTPARLCDIAKPQPGLKPSRSALSVTIAPRLLSCLRIKQLIAELPARLDTWPVASGYQGGIYAR